MRLRVSSRISDLAMLQSLMVGEKLAQLIPNLKIDYLFRESLGDKNLTDPLWKIPQKGVFTEDFYKDLTQGSTDFVVHSWKDLATEVKPDTFIVATLPRADHRDVLFVKKSSLEKIKETGTIKIFTSSPRRTYHLEAFLKTFLPFSIQHAEFDSVRGNIPTRLRKLNESSMDGLVMAKAALDRLLESQIAEFAPVQQEIKKQIASLQFMIIPTVVCPPAPAQGAIAIEVLRERQDLIQLFSQMNHQPTYEEVQIERDILKKYGGGCHQKIGVFSKKYPFGELLISSGEHENLHFKKNVFKSFSKIHGIGNAKKESLNSKNYYDTRILPFTLSEKINALEITKEESFHSLEQYRGILWTSGIETWKKLAQKGIWIHGSQESFGDDSDMRLKNGALASLQQPLCWGKLTHSGAQELYDSAGIRSKLEAISSYQLIQKEKFPDLSAVDSFYWRSGSLFLEAAQTQPSILTKMHSCGMGHTKEIIENFFRCHKTENQISVFPTEQHWRDHVANSNSV